METQNSRIDHTSPRSSHRSGEPRQPDNGRIWGGMVIVIIGGILLARQVGVFIPHWILSWPMFLIALGLFIGARHSFRNPGWIIPVIFGTVFLLDDYYYAIHIWKYFWPVFLIGIGFFMILRSRKKHTGDTWSHAHVQEGSADVLDAVTIFGGVKKNIISKTFKGGEAVTVFGGTELNLMQADTDDKIVLELVQVFAGTKLIIPPHWKIHTDEMVTIFGGLNDKRPVPVQVAEDTKVIILKGTCIFGGIDIKSY